MANPFYNASGAPVTGSAGASATIRSEFTAIAAGFALLPGALTANKAVVINAGGTAMTTTTGSLALAGDFSTTGAFNTVFAQQASITITLPLTADTLVGRATTDTLTNKTLTSPTMTAPVLGTPASGTLTNCTGLPVASGISGLAAGIATFLATPSSANLIAAMTDETGTGSNVFATSPTLVTPLLGTPTSGVLTNCTGYTLANLASIGAGVATLLTGASSGTGGPAGTVSPTFTGTVGGAAATWTGNNTAAAFIPSGATVPSNGMYLAAANRLSWATNTTFMMALSTTGLGIGVVAPANILDLASSATNASANISLLNSNGGTAAQARLAFSNGTNGFSAGVLGTGFTTNGLFVAGNAFVSGDLNMIMHSTGALLFAAGGTAEVGRVNAGSKNLTWGTTTNIANMDNAGGQIGAFRGFYTTAGNGLSWGAATFLNGTDSTSINVIVSSNGVSLLANAAAWSATSDYRAKNVTGEFTGSGQIIDAVAVHFAALKIQPGNVKAMFLAHELQTAVPYAVHGEKDGENMQQIESTDPLVPILWAEIRDLRRRLALQEARA